MLYTLSEIRDSYFKLNALDFSYFFPQLHPAQKENVYQYMALYSHISLIKASFMPSQKTT